MSINFSDLFDDFLINKKENYVFFNKIQKVFSKIEEFVFSDKFYKEIQNKFDEIDVLLNEAEEILKINPFKINGVVYQTNEIEEALSIFKVIVVYSRKDYEVAQELLLRARDKLLESTVIPI